MDDLSVILLIVDAEGVSSFEFERDAPRTVDVDRISGRVEASQRMKVPTRNMHVFSLGSLIESIQPRDDAVVHPNVDFSASASLEQIPKALVPEALEHTTDVARSVTLSRATLQRRC